MRPNERVMKSIPHVFSQDAGYWTDRAGYAKALEGSEVPEKYQIDGAKT